MKKSILKPVLSIGVAAALVGAAVFFFNKPKAADKAPAPAKAALTVTTTQATPAQLPIKLAATGKVAAWQEAGIGSESGGLRLTEVRVNVGDIVRKGAVLAVFSADSVNADVAQARAALMEAEANAAE